MVKKYCIIACKSESFSGCGLSFHSFPIKQDIKQRWLDVIPIFRNITKNSVVCSLHFKREDFCEIKSRRILKSDAVPSIFPPPKNKQITVLSEIRFNLPKSSVDPTTTQEPSLGASSPSPSTSTPVVPPMKKFLQQLKNLGSKIGLRQKLNKTIIFSHV